MNDRRMRDMDCGFSGWDDFHDTTVSVSCHFLRRYCLLTDGEPSPGGE
jgi:hypothetical protein